jgi:hypothetical protein
MAKIEYGSPGIAGVKSIQYLGEDGLPAASEMTPVKVAGGALMAYGAYKALTVSIDAAIGAGALIAGYMLWRRP